MNEIDPKLIEVAALAICQSGKFETGQGTCAAICMEQFGPVRNRPCAHLVDVHGKLASAILSAVLPLHARAVASECAMIAELEGHKGLDGTGGEWDSACTITAEDTVACIRAKYQEPKP